MLQFYLDAIQFAAGDLEAPTAPRDEPPGPQAVPGTQPAPGWNPASSRSSTARRWTAGKATATIWSVHDGAITGQTTADTAQGKQLPHLEGPGGELRAAVEVPAGRGQSGIYYRAQKRPAGQTQGDPLVGTQADFDASGRWTGVIMEYLLRDVLAERGEKVMIDEKGKKQVRARGRPAELLKAVKTKRVERLHGGRQRRQRGAEDQRRDDVRTGGPRPEAAGPRLAGPAGPRRPADARAVQGHRLAETLEDDCGASCRHCAGGLGSSCFAAFPAFFVLSARGIRTRRTLVPSGGMHPWPRRRAVFRWSGCWHRKSSNAVGKLDTQMKSPPSA